MSKKTILLIAGGMSSEHRISLISAYNVMQGLKQAGHPILVVGISLAGEWLYYPDQHFSQHALEPQAVTLAEGGIPVTAVRRGGEVSLIELSTGRKIQTLDVAFPVLHGPYGEDGSVQGYLTLLGLPYVGCDVLSSALCMNKIQCKRLLAAQGIPVAPFLSFHQAERAGIVFEQVKATLGLPLFIKPANAGSSVGISKVESLTEFESGLDKAFREDSHILIEQCIVGRELECAVLGNRDPKPSVLGEIVPLKSFYSYEAKYLDEKGATLIAPAVVSETDLARVQDLAIRAFQIMGCRGLARVDCFLQADGHLYVNEINTLPGFTSISMYPTLWKHSGLDYVDLLNRLIELSLEPA